MKAKETEKQKKYQARELKKLWILKVIPIVVGVPGIISNGLKKRLEEVVIGANLPDYTTAEIGYNSDKSPGEMRRLVITKTSANTTKY